MPIKAYKQCRDQPCKELVQSPATRCTKHNKERNNKYSKTFTASSNQSFYSSPAWKSTRRIHIETYPYCCICLIGGVRTIAKHVDHIIERKDRPDLAFEPSNLQSLCVAHHSSKTLKDRWNKHDINN